MDGRTDGRSDRRMDGRGENYVPQPSVGDKNCGN